MFKRAKITALLVAAASVISIIPASAATSVKTKDGKFDSAVAYNGRYIYEGYKDDGSNSVYVSDNSKDTEVDKADDYDDYNVKYGDKYVIARESDSENYLVDISSGKIDTGTTVEDKQEDAANSLKRTLKNTDRYGKNVSVDKSNLERIGQKQFGDVWYKYTATPGSDAENHDNVTSDGKFIGFVNNSGTYVDASSKANLRVISGGKTVNIDEFGKANNDVTAELISMNVIAQDNDYIYTLTEVGVSGGSTSGSEDHQTFVQKISKSRSGNKDGADLPKSVDSYMLTDGFKDEDSDKAVNLITSSSLSSSDSIYSVKKGTLYLTQKTASDEIKVTKFSMEKNKVALDGGSDKLDVYLVKAADDEKHDITSGSSPCIDVDGNVWGINKGKIFKFNGLTPSDIYTCETSLNRLDVYNENNFVAWSTSNEIYAAVVNGKAASGTSDNNNNNNGNNSNNNNNNNNNNNSSNNNGSGTNNNGTSNVVPSGWVKQGGYWYFYYSDGSKRTGWYYELGNWYYFYGNGQMATAFINLNGAYYYLNPNSDGNQGAMKVGWQKINGYWYYFNPVSDSYGYEGMMAKSGWRCIGGVWYYFWSDGTMAANTRVNGYYVNSSGAWVPGV